MTAYLVNCPHIPTPSLSADSTNTGLRLSPVRSVYGKRASRTSPNEIFIAFDEVGISVQVGLVREVREGTPFGIHF